MKMVDLTTEDLNILDPTRKASTWMATLKSHTETKALPVLNGWRISPDEILERYTRLMSKLKLDPSYFSFNEEQLKHFQPQ
jgi:hypothetical protein